MSSLQSESSPKSVQSFHDIQLPPSPPRVIFFDAVGTLFGVRDSVGAAYCHIAQQFGVTTAPEPVNCAFLDSFRDATSMAFPEVAPQDIPQHEYDWWRAIAVKTFKQVGVFDQFQDFSAFFEALYAYFATAQPWFVYGDVVESLQRWQHQGIELGVLSNFDSRLYPVLEALDLATWFKTVTISTAVGAAKPDAKIFAIALQKHGCPPEAAWHVGDSRSMDYEGAKAAGLHPILIQRQDDDE